MSKWALDEEQLREHLKEQFSFLEVSAESFDSGYTAEAKRLAVTIRILLHDSGRSHSILGQLNMKDRTFFDTSSEFDPRNLVTHSGLVLMRPGPNGMEFAAKLDAARIQQWTPFLTWWEAVVFVDQDRRPLSRKQLILTAANKDGGAHVDPKLEEVYAELSRANSLGWMTGSDEAPRPMNPPERPAIRQIAHEVLKTLKPGYAKGG